MIRKIALVVGLGFVMLVAIVVLFAQNREAGSQSGNDSTERPLSSSMEKRFALMEERVLGSEVTPLLELFDGNVESAGDVLYVYSQHDCSSCIAKGFNVIEEINERRESGVIGVVALGAFVSLQVPENVALNVDFAHSPDMEFLEELRHLQTPIMLFLDEERKVADVYIVTIYADDRHRNRFIDTVL